MRGRPSIGTSARPIDPPDPVGRTPTQEPSLQPPVPQEPKFRTLPRSVGLLSSPIFILDCSDKAPSLLTTTQTEAQVESAREHPEAGHVDVVWTSTHGLRRLGKECLSLGPGPKSQYPVPITEMVKPLSQD